MTLIARSLNSGSSRGFLIRTRRLFGGLSPTCYWSVDSSSLLVSCRSSWSSVDIALLGRMSTSSFLVKSCDGLFLIESVAGFATFESDQAAIPLLDCKAEPAMIPSLGLLRIFSSATNVVSRGSDRASFDCARNDSLVSPHRQVTRLVSPAWPGVACWQYRSSTCWH